MKTIFEGFGAAILILLLRVWPLLSSRHSAFYHNYLPIHTMIWGDLIDVVGLTLLLSALFKLLEKSGSGRRILIWGVAFAVLLPILAGDLAAVWQTSIPALWTRLLFWVALFVALGFWWFRPLIYQRGVEGMRVALLLIGCGLAWMVPELLYFGLRAQSHDVEGAIAAPALSRNHAEGGPRIIWLIFDELSYNQAFDHRLPGLALPAFDRFKSESTSFSDLLPAGYTTERVIPSFFLGHVVENLVSNLDGYPRVTLAGQKGWHRFDSNATLFADAKRLGWTTGVVGWYNPYCRILAGTLDSCYWRVGDGLYTGTSPDQTPLENAAAPVKEFLRSWKPEGNFPEQEKHASDLEAILPQAQALIRDQNIRFALIHLPIPHPPGIYDRRPGQHPPVGTYLDNLVVADHTLAQLLATIESTSSSNRTAVIVCSDHSWRIPLWRPTPQWSKEEQFASKGHFDQRPVLMIHDPGQQNETDITRPFALIGIHDIIERMLRGQSPLQ